MSFNSYCIAYHLILRWYLYIYTYSIYIYGICSDIFIFIYTWCMYRRICHREYIMSFSLIHRMRMFLAILHCGLVDTLTNWKLTSIARIIIIAIYLYIYIHALNSLPLMLHRKCWFVKSQFTSLNHLLFFTFVFSTLTI